jgi:hypothetical protein
MSDELQELKQRLSKLSDDELIEMVSRNASDYRQEALDYAKAELKYRRVDWSETTAKAPEPSVGPSPEPQEPASKRQDSTCLLCGGRLRTGTLVAEKELTIIFGDMHEERFVRVNACTQCGQLLLVVDYETDVAP